MRVSNNGALIILSAHQAGLTRTYNAGSHKVMLASLDRNKIPYKEVKGCYKGREEKSVIIPGEKTRFAEVMGRFHHQESYLYLDNERGAWFVDLATERRVFAGHFREVPKAVALKHDGWTESEGRYWVID